MTSIWILLYEILTQLILLLSYLRGRITTKHTKNQIRTDRTFKEDMMDHLQTESGAFLECCDCGLLHKMFIKDGIFYEQPVRPKGYNYRLRRFGTGPSDESRPEVDW